MARGLEGAMNPDSKGRTESFVMPMPLMNTAFAPGHCIESIEAIEPPELRDIAWAEYRYFSGDAMRASEGVEPYLLYPDISIRLSACLVYAYANLTIGRIDRVHQGLAGLRAIAASLDDETPPDVRAAATALSVAASVLLHLPVSIDTKVLLRVIGQLPAGLRMFALYIQAHRAYLQKDYGRSIGIAEAGFAIQDTLYPIPAIYLHLAAVMSCMSLRRTAEAKTHLLAAWEIARPDDLIESFAEHHGLLGGMLEAVIKPEWPDDFKRIIAITYRFSSGWRKVHNPNTGHDVADDLTTTEFAICMLAARGWSNKEIAVHLGVSSNTVKQHLSSAFLKLGIARRQDLERHMLL